MRLRMTLSQGDRLGPYEVLSPIGAGGMGEVWKARDTRLERTVAIKRLNPQHRGRFRAEAQAIAALNHPHICQIFDVGEDYLVLEFVTGTPLRGPLREAEARRLGLQIAGALDAAHKRGILHRDLKPDNVMLTESGAKLLDFGLAKMVAPGVTQTTEGTVLGTAPYMSPEAAHGRPLDARSDLFSFGALLYEVVSGRRAFGGATTLEILNAVVAGEPAVLDSQLWPTIRRCLAKIPSHRFQSAGEVRDALEQLSVGAITTALKPSVAVLPFANMSGDREQEYFSDGLTEEIIGALAKIPGLKVIARTSAFAYKGQNADIRRIAQTLGVAHVLEGSVRRSGNRLRVTAQLISAEDGSHLWSERYDREMADVFDIQDELSMAIARVLQGTLAKSDEAAVSQMRRHIPKPEAHDAFLKAWHASVNIPTTMDIRRQFEHAIALDPEFAQARAQYAAFMSYLVHIGVAAPHEAMPLIRAEARKAVELDASLADAHAILAVVAAAYDYDWSEAERRYVQALSHGGLSAMARSYCAFIYLRGAGRLGEAVEQGELAVQIDPIHPACRSMLALSLAYVGRFEEAEALSRESLALAPNNVTLYSAFGLVRATQGRFDEALTLAERAAAHFPATPVTLAPFAGLLTRVGERARAEEVLDRIRAGPPHWLSGGMFMYCLYAGDEEGIADWAEKAARDRWPVLAGTIQSPLARGVRAGPRWPKLSRLMNLPEAP
ncbi:MAG: protein kinase [Acidobacteriia bacterium]|nr:protein kinase [Terriglobia bacterium]